MPTGDPVEHDFWCNLGPSPTGDFNAIWYLEQHGWRMTRQFFWVAPLGIRPQDEFRAMNYLIDEWDYGGQARDNGAPETPLAPKLQTYIPEEAVQEFERRTSMPLNTVRIIAAALAIFATLIVVLFLNSGPRHVHYPHEHAASE